jgi:hypothetical protein
MVLPACKITRITSALAPGDAAPAVLLRVRLPQRAAH